MFRKILFSLAVAIATGPVFGAEAFAEEWARPELLISTKELAGKLSRPNIRVVDGRANRAYRTGHIPGAVNIFFSDVANLQSRKKNGFPHYVSEAERIFGAAGIDADTTVIVYDGGHGPVASGVWFALEFFGHKKVRVLNGGLRKWVAEGWPLDKDAVQVKKKKFVAKPSPEKVVTGAWLLKNLDSKDITIIDTRSLEEYNGTKVFWGVDRGGHVPGAKLLNWKELMGEVETFKSPGEIKDILAKHGITRDTKVVTYCHQGIGRSTDLALAMRLLGYDNALEYTGSWQEWSNDAKFPVEK